MLRLLVLGSCLLGLTASASRGDDDARQRRVKVALALSCACGGCKAPDERAVAVTARLDWFVAATSAVEVAPMPRASPAKRGPCDCPKKCDDCKCPVCPPPASMGVKTVAEHPATGELTFSSMQMESTPYKDVIARVRKGERVLLMVRPPAGNRYPVRLNCVTLRCDELKVDAGLYDCYLGPNAVPTMQMLETWVKPMPKAIALPPPSWQFGPPCVGRA